MPFEHLSQAQYDAVYAALLDGLGYAATTRTALLGGIPTRYSGSLQGAGTSPNVGLDLDLRALNGRERLTDGSVPLKVYLHNALRLAGPIETMEPVRNALSDIEARTTGARRVSLVELREVKEKILFQDDMVSYGFMLAGLTAAKAVAKLEVARFECSTKVLHQNQPVIYLGTGWLIAPGLLMTNHHVINARNEDEPAAPEADLRSQALSTTARFDYDSNGAAGTTTTCGELVAFSAALDYAVLRIDAGGREPLSISDAPIADTNPQTYTPVNIIQHPDGQPKRYGIRNNLVTSATDKELRYFTDTFGGSSGAPVLDDRWKVVALHRGSVPVSGISFQGRQTAYVNVGTQIRAILADLGSRYPEVSIVFAATQR